MTTSSAERDSTIFDQPKAVWAVAFAAMIAFMGIGLVSPILPALTHDMGATRTQSSLLFTSYLVITGIAMFFTSWVSSRIGTRATLLSGLTIIVLASTAAGFAPTIEWLIICRAFWGLGNALFISTALASIVASARGGTGPAIILYEAALGLGIAVGPLIGGLLGQIEWHAPFFGTSVLMTIAFIAIVVLLKDKGVPTAPSSVTAPFKALRVPAILVLAIVAFFYNMGFFVLMSYTPYPLGFTALGIGLVFTGWGIAVALTSVFAAPTLAHRYSPLRVLWVVLATIALTLIAAGVFVHNTPVLVVLVIIAGLQLGLVNTLLTEAIMEASDLPRAVASSAYSGVRFMGGAIAPPTAAALAGTFGSNVPFYFGAIAVAIAAVLTVSFRRTLSPVEKPTPDNPQSDAEAITFGE